MAETFTPGPISQEVALELYDSLKTILDGFEKGHFVRNIQDDDKSDWAVKLLPFIVALSKAQAAIQKASGQ